jgi:hypothetical protein
VTPDEALHVVLSRAPDHDLRTDRLERPPDRWRAIALETITFARACLTLPAQIHLRWVHAPGRTRGQAMREGDVYEISLNLASLGVYPDELREVVLHEAQHIADLYSGDRERMTSAESEERAIAFAARITGRR